MNVTEVRLSIDSIHRRPQVVVADYSVAAAA
jgi:hypothetical protein